MILSETQERFLKAIAAKVPLDAIAEIHFFQPIKQGGIESGVAVIATRPERKPEPVHADPPAGIDADAVTSHDSENAEPADDAADLPAGDSDHETVQSELDLTAVSADAPPPDDPGTVATSAEPSEAADGSATEAAPSDAADAAPPAASSPAERYVIYTARYRLTLKGPDRGKWETNVVAEADAPLLTVDAVVRGVQRRSGDVEDPVRLTGDELVGLMPRQPRPAA
jgi:hypothetical protein